MQRKDLQIAGGVEYIEVRSLDLNVFDPVGINQETMRFIEAFLIYCMLEESELINKTNNQELIKNHTITATHGRENNLLLQKNGVSITLKSWPIISSSFQVPLHTTPESIIAEASDNFIGEKNDYGITAALIPTNLDGISIGRRHLPMNVPFQNGPTSGKDVFVPLDFIIGGKEMAGKGWKMLVECLSVGRAITLPSTAMGGGQAAAYASGAYAQIRKQFNLPISQFDGIKESLARIAGYTYTMNAAVSVTSGAMHIR